MKLTEQQKQIIADNIEYTDWYRRPSYLNKQFLDANLAVSAQRGSTITIVCAFTTVVMTKKEEWQNVGRGDNLRRAKKNNAKKAIIGIVRTKFFPRYKKIWVINPETHERIELK